MKKDDCFVLGYIQKPHGLDGTLHFSIDSDEPEAYTEIDACFVEIGGQLVPYFVEYLHFATQRVLLKLEGIDSQEQARELQGCQLYLPLDLLPKLPEGEFYYHQIIDYSVVDATKGTLGTVSRIYDEGPQDLIGMRYQDHEVLIPIVDDIVLRADHQKQELHVNLPEGLVDIYLED